MPSGSNANAAFVLFCVYNQDAHIDIDISACSFVLPENIINNYKDVIALNYDICVHILKYMSIHLTLKNDYRRKLIKQIH